MLKLLLLFFSLVVANNIFAQVILPIPENIQTTYTKGTRTADGKPGKNYWQNTADYDIDVELNPTSRLVKGSVSIHYTNNSPDTLRQIYFKLYPNVFAKGAQRLLTIDPEDASEGMQIEKIRIGNDDVSTYSVKGTNMIVIIPAISPGKTIDFNIAYSYTLNKKSHYRTGEVEPNALFVAYFFPRIAVYDDIDGWNKQPYLLAHEFYNDFCNFRASVKVPKHFVVWATGDLLNCHEVLNEKYCSLLRQSEMQDNIISIVDSMDLLSKQVTTDHPINTWKFEAKHVTDFVFATSDHYLWQSSSVVVDSITKRRTRTDVAFNANHKDFFDVPYYNRETVKHMSHSFPKWPFPYNHITVFDGLDQMEYPMMVNDNPTSTKFDAITLTDHEVFHTMFPFYMGTNETKYGWMDEGWATIGEWLISPMIDSTIEDDYGMRRYNITAGREKDVPVTTPTYMMTDTSLFLNSYPKPGLGYLYVKDMLGDKLFFKALHYYIAQWNGKHPMPYDFFNCMNTGAGKNMNWFWKRWFFDDGIPDLAIQSVKKNKSNYEVTIQSIGNKPVPVDLNIEYADGSKSKVHRSIQVWENSNAVKVSIPANKPMSKLSLGSLYVADANDSNNVYLF
jgi:hypothetical protein